jgi:ABC-2 type transport system ATP-binding protein
MADSPHPAIEIINVTKSFPGETRPALENINASIREGIITGIVGPDAAGKTTLIRLMTSLLRPTKGEVILLGLNTLKDSNAIHDITGYMPQKFGLYEDLTVLENLTLYGDLQGLSQQEKSEAFEKMLTFTSLKPFTDRLAGKLSGGMKQKLGLACALLSRPKVLLLDEPTVGVDPVSRRELWKMMKELVSQKITVVWSTSYLDEASKCDDVLLLNEGKLLFNGPPSELTKRVEGRVFLLDVPEKGRRTALSTLLNIKGITDGVVQGKKIRVVLKPNVPITIQDYPSSPTEPRFEDAFVDILGGGPGGTSILAKTVHQRKATHIVPIHTENLTKKFGDFTAASDISITVKRGEIFGLLGPNGAGKSTTFKMLCGLLQPTHGKALVSGHDLKTSTSKARSHIGYMAQKFSLYSDLGVKENLDFFSGAYGLQGALRKNRIDLMTEIFDLGPYLSNNAGLLSLGYKQRLALACAVMHEPDVLFLDEPTSGVDPLTRREFWTHINGMAEKGITIMVTTHFMEEAEYCDRIALIYQARNIATGTPDELKEKVRSTTLPNPTLEDAFITLIEQTDAQNSLEEKK